MLDTFALVCKIPYPRNYSQVILTFNPMHIRKNILKLSFSSLKSYSCYKCSIIIFTFNYISRTPSPDQPAEAGTVVH